jgi:hypothetical protein
MTEPIKTKPTDDGGSAFPHGEIIAEQYDSAGNFSGNIVQHESAGMSLRDWFAGKRPEKDRVSDPVGWELWQATWQAKIRFIRADAMLAARKGDL